MPVSMTVSIRDHMKSAIDHYTQDLVLAFEAQPKICFLGIADQPTFQIDLDSVTP